MTKAISQAGLTVAAFTDSLSTSLDLSRESSRWAKLGIFCELATLCSCFRKPLQQNDNLYIAYRKTSPFARIG